jgi:hypothetical protein
MSNKTTLDLANVVRDNSYALTGARSRYSCFDHFGEDRQAYGYAAGFNVVFLLEQR